MMAMFGFVAGYLLGAKAGPKAVAQLSEAWKVIQGSDEFKVALSGAVSVAATFMQKAMSPSGRGASNWGYGNAVSALVGGVADMMKKRNLRVVS